MSSQNGHESEPEHIAETDNFFVWRTMEEDGYIYHVELGAVTLHLLSEEWDELIELVKSAD